MNGVDYAYYVMVIVECAGNGCTSQVVGFHTHTGAEEFISITDGKPTSVDGQVVSCVRLYRR